MVILIMKIMAILKIFLVFFFQKDAAEEAKNRVIKDLFEKEMKKTYTTVKKISDIEVDILEIETDELVNFELGGYCE